MAQLISSTLRIEDIAGRLLAIPSSSRVLPTLNRMLRFGDAPLSEVADLVRLDPGVSARVFAAGYRLCLSKEHRCDTVADAIHALGYDSVGLLVASLVEHQVVVHPLSHYGLTADEFWQSSLACAIAAELLATRVGEDAAMAYLAGLLHRCGMVAIDSALDELEPSLAFAPRAFPREFSDAERTLLGFCHAQVGAAFLSQRGFPDAVVEAVRTQADPHGATRDPRLASVLHAACWLRAAICSDDRSLPDLPAAACLFPIGLNPLELAGYVVEVRLRLGAARSTLDQWQRREFRRTGA